MHDTPKKYLFKKLKRAYSSGCIRLEKPFQLAEYFLQDKPQYDHQTVSDLLEENKTTYIRMKNPIPVFITYITAWVDKTGHLHFREDIYKKYSQGPDEDPSDEIQTTTSTAPITKQQTEER